MPKQAVQDFKAGEQKSFMFLIGQVMRETRGTAEPNKVNQILKKLIKNS